MYKKCKKKVNWSVDDQRLKSKEDKDRDQLVLCNSIVSTSSDKVSQMKMVSMTICNLFRADGATPVGNTSKLIQLRLNFSIVQIELTVSDTIIMERRENSIEVLIAPTATTTKTLDFKHPMVDSSIHRSKFTKTWFLMHFSISSFLTKIYFYFFIAWTKWKVGNKSSTMPNLELKRQPRKRKSWSNGQEDCIKDKTLIRKKIIFNSGQKFSSTTEHFINNLDFSIDNWFLIEA